jgi:long-chain acyl-CoA synthetase
MVAEPVATKPWVSRYDQGVPATLEPYPAIPLQHFLEEAARQFPDRTATIFKPHPKFGGSQLSYRELNALADRFAAGLAALGVQKGDRVLLFMPNMPQFVVAYYGSLKLGAIVVAANPQYTAAELEHQLRDSGAETVVVLSRFYNTLRAALQHGTPVKRVIVTNIKEYMPGLLKTLFTLTRERKDGHRVTLDPGHLWFQDFLRDAPATPPKVTVGPDDIALFQYSGGTTGVPKAAVALHRNLVANTLQIRSWLADTRLGAETVLMAIPLFHVYGMMAGMSFGIQAAATLVLIPDARELLTVMAAINAYHPTVFPGVPRLYNAINNHPDVQKYDLKSIRACISGSAPLLIEVKSKFEALTGGKLVEGYGLSEAPTATHCNPIYGTNKAGSIGLPFPDVDCRLADLETGVDVERGGVGELLIRGPQVMWGYWNMPEETAGTLKDGWLYTGDIARMDDEGYFYIVDRKKEVIKAGGFQVWPRDIEEVLAQHPKVLEAAVAGVPDAARGGETVKAWVVLKPGQQASEDELKDFCRERLAPYKLPRMIEFRGELPKTTVGKILRRVLVQEHKDRQKTASG